MIFLLPIDSTKKTAITTAKPERPGRDGHSVAPCRQYDERPPRAVSIRNLPARSPPRSRRAHRDPVGGRVFFPVGGGAAAHPYRLASGKPLCPAGKLVPPAF